MVFIPVNFSHPRETNFKLMYKYMYNFLCGDLILHSVLNDNNPPLLLIDLVFLGAPAQVGAQIHMGVVPIDPHEASLRFRWFDTLKF